MTYMRTKFFRIKPFGRFKLAAGQTGPFTKLDNRTYEKEPGVRVRGFDLNTKVIEWPPRGFNL